MSEFKREERYVVVKLKDLDDTENEALRDFLQSWQIPTVQSVVVPSHYPMHEDTWKAIQEYAETGSYTRQSDLRDSVSDLLQPNGNDDECLDWYNKAIDDVLALIDKP